MLPALDALDGADGVEDDVPFAAIAHVAASILEADAEVIVAEDAQRKRFAVLANSVGARDDAFLGHIAHERLDADGRIGEIEHRVHEQPEALQAEQFEDLAVLKQGLLLGRGLIVGVGLDG